MASSATLNRRVHSARGTFAGAAWAAIAAIAGAAALIGVAASTLPVLGSRR